MFNKKGFLKNFAKLTVEQLRFLKKLRHMFFPVSFTKFSRTLPGDRFWIGLMAKQFNSVLLIFLNSQLYHAPSESHYYFGERKNTFQWRKHNWILNNKLSPWHYFIGILAEVFKVVFIIFSKFTGKYLCKSLCVGVSFLIKLTELPLLCLLLL